MEIVHNIRMNDDKVLSGGSKGIRVEGFAESVLSLCLINFVILGKNNNLRKLLGRSDEHKRKRDKQRDMSMRLHMVLMFDEGN